MDMPRDIDLPKFRNLLAWVVSAFGVLGSCTKLVCTFKQDARTTILHVRK